MKAKEKEMKDEKEEERQVSIAPLECQAAYTTNKYLSHRLQRRVQAIKDKRAAKEERERYEKMAEKMHKKRVERLKRKEKRNKLINS
jgi:rRNA-processing protein CGR1